MKERVLGIISIVAAVSVACHSQPRSTEDLAVKQISLTTGGNNNNSSGNDPSANGGNDNNSSNTNSSNSGNENGGNEGTEGSVAPHNIVANVMEIQNYVLMYSIAPEIADGLLDAGMAQAASQILAAPYLSMSDELEAVLNHIKVQTRPGIPVDELDVIASEIKTLGQIAIQQTMIFNINDQNVDPIPYVATLKYPHRVLQVGAIEEAIEEYFEANGFETLTAAAKVEIKNAIERNLAKLDEDVDSQIPDPAFDEIAISVFATLQMLKFLEANPAIDEYSAQNHAENLRDAWNQKIDLLDFGLLTTAELFKVLKLETEVSEHGIKINNTVEDTYFWGFSDTTKIIFDAGVLALGMGNEQQGASWWKHGGNWQGTSSGFITTRAALNATGHDIDEENNYIKVFGNVPRDILIPVVMDQEGRILPMVERTNKEWIGDLKLGANAPQSLINAMKDANLLPNEE